MTDLDELNPFDFQRPVRTTKRLVGRQWQLRLFADALDSLVEGSPKHALVLGPTGYGKTSLLNGFADEALRAGVLPVRFRPSDSVVSSGEAFFEAMLTAAMLSVEATADLRDDPRFQNWLAQIGRSDPGPTHPTLLSHVQPFTDATTIARDCRVISELAREAELKGVVMLLDDGEALRDDEIISDTLAALLETLDDWMFVIAGRPRILDDLAASEPSLLRSLSLIPVTPIESIFDVSELLIGPLHRELRDKFDFSLGDFIDFSLATAGNPRLQKMLAHDIWIEARAAGFEQFALTTDVLEEFLVRRRLQYPHADLPEPLEARLDFVAAASEVPKQDLEALLPVVSMEEFTLLEASLGVLADEAVERDVEQRAADRANELDSLLTRLDGAGVVDFAGDRFKVAAEGFGKAYLRRLMLERLDKHPDPPAPSYGAFAGARFFERMCSNCGFETPGPDVVARFRVKRDPDSEAPTPGTALAEALHKEDPLAFLDSPVVSLSWETTPPMPTRDSILFVGVTFRVGVDSTMSMSLEVVEVGALFWAERGRDTKDTKVAIEQWLGDREEMLRSYRLAFESAVVEVASPDLSDQLVAVAAPRSVVDRVFKFFGAGDVAGSVSYLQRVTSSLEVADRKSSTQRVRSALSDAYQRLGFLGALLGDADVVDGALRRSAQLSDSAYWLDSYNGAYMRALRQEFAAAADLVRAAEEHLSTDAPNTYMLLYLPLAPGWSPADLASKTASVSGPDLVPFLRTQALVYDALAGQFNPNEFVHAVEELGELSASQMRLIAWTLYTKFGFEREAKDYFRKAAEAGDPSAAKEADFVAGKKL